MLRDQVCRTPYCGAPIRHADHVADAARGGATSLANGQGLCEACNHTKQAAGWRSVARPDGTIEITTPSGFRYESRPPSLAPPTGSRGRAPSDGERPRAGAPPPNQ